MAERVKQLREDRRLTQGQLARLAGVSTAYVQRLEQGDYQKPSLAYLTKLATALGVEVSALTGDAGELTSLEPEGGIYSFLRQYAPNMSIQEVIESIETLNAMDPRLRRFWRMFFKGAAEFAAEDRRGMNEDKGDQDIS